jgi:hypothetical protein
MFVDNEYIQDSKKKADAFNIFICNQAMVDDSNVKSSPFLSNIHITEEQVFDHLSTLDISKASGEYTHYQQTLEGSLIFY